MSYLDAGGNPASKEWTFTVLGWTGPTKDKIGGYPGLIYSPAVFTADQGGHSGKAGDYALDGTKKGGAVAVLNVSWLNSAVAADEMSVSFWQKKYDITASSSFYLQSPSQNAEREFQAHVPWDNSHIYFDTGCCTTDTQRLEGDFTASPDFTDATYWTAWHHYVFAKKGATKQVWVDGKLFLDGTGADPLHADISKLFIGSGADGTSNNHGVIDDFAVYSKQLVEADAKALTAGALPSALGAAKGLIAYWDFNDAKTTILPPALSVVRNADKSLTVTFEGTLETAPAVTGPWTKSAATSPAKVSPDGAGAYARARR